MKRFLAAAAVAPLCFAAAQAYAQTTVDTARTTSAQTSTTGDLTISAAGSITVTNDAAVTLDSNNAVIHNGSIDIKDATNPATGILVTSGSGSVTTAGIINVTDTEVLKDNDGDGDLDGPFVTSNVTKFGVRFMNPFTGAFTQSAGQILIRGNNSAAIAFENGLTGDLTIRGQNVLVGANSYGLRINGPVTGQVDIGGTISAQGDKSEGVSIFGPVNGRVILGGGVVATGFRYVTRALPFDLAKLDADDLLIGGPAVRIAGSVSGGVLVNAAQPNTDNLNPDNDSTTPDIADPNPDEDGDGIPDVNETDATITSYGSAPGLLVGGPGNIVLGNVGTGISAYGVSIQGTVVGNGLFDKVDSTAVRIGGEGGTVDTGGGIRVGGTVLGSAALANTKGLQLATGAIAPSVVVDGRVQAITTSDLTVNPTSTALQIDAGANAPSLTVNGSVIASINGPTGTSTAVLDKSGTLASITNTGIISASQAQVTASDVLVGKNIALDLRANSTGVSILQTHNAAEATTPLILGDILFGSGNSSLIVKEGSVTGDITFGAGTNTLVLDGTKTTHDADNVATTVINGIITGRITSVGQLSMSVLSGTLTNTFAGTVPLSDLTVGKDGKLGFTLDPAATNGETGTRYLVSGAANFAGGSQIDIRFASKLTTGTTFNLIHAGSLINGGLTSDLLGETPFFYKTALTSTATDLSVTVARRTAEEAGLSGGPAAAYESIFAGFDADAGVEKALLSKTDEASFKELYNQFLPDYSGAAFHSLATGARAVQRAQADEPAGMNTNQRRSWLQEVGFSTRNNGDANPGDITYDSAGFGVAGGVESAMQGGFVHGLSAALISSDIDNANRRGFSSLTASALLGSYYMRDQVNEHFLLDGSVTGGYAWFNSDRHVIDTDPEGARVLQRTASGKWDGAVAAARFGASYEVPFGRYYVRPDAVIDAVYLYENAYNESGGGASVDLAVNHRTSYEVGAEAGVTFGAHFGRVFRWSPEFRIGYRSNLAEGLSDTTARFLVGGNPFLLQALGVDKNRLILRAAIKGGSRYANVALEATGDLGDIYTAYEGRLVVRFIF